MAGLTSEPGWKFCRREKILAVAEDCNINPRTSSSLPIRYTDWAVPFSCKWKGKKVKWSCYRSGVAQRVGTGIALLFHDRGTRRGWVVSSTPRPHFTPGKDPVPILQEAGWAPGKVWTGGKSLPHRDSIPDPPARSQSLYLLSYPAHANGTVLLLNKPRRRVSIWVPSYWRSLISFQADFCSDCELVASNMRHCVEHLTVFSLNNESVELWGFYHRHPVINDSALCCEIPGSVLCCIPQIPLILIPLFTRNLEANDDGDLTGRQNGITPVWFLRLCKLKILLKLIH